MSVPVTLMVRCVSLFSVSTWPLPAMLSPPLPASVMVVHVEAVYFQCSRAVVRAELWNAERQVDRRSLPSPGTILREVTARNAKVETFDGKAYDEALPGRVKATLY